MTSVDESENPWNTTDSEVKYDNPWIKVTEHQTINSDGGSGIYGVVHYKNIALGIIPLDEDYNTWLVGQYRYPLNKYSWEICEGGGPVGQNMLTSAKRELREELGISAEEWTPLLDLHLSNSVSDEFGRIFIAKKLSYANPEPEEGEVLQLKKLPIKEAYEMVMDGQITDSISVAGIMKTMLLIEKGTI